MTMEQTLPGVLLTIIRKRLFTVGLFLLCIEVLITVSSSRVGFWSYTTTDDFATFQRITVDAKTGDVFAAGKNSIFKFNGLLKLVTQFKTGPVIDDLRCHPSDVDCSRETMMDNNAYILEIDPSLNCLLFCGSVQQGLCSVLSLNNLTLRTLHEVNNSSNYLGGGETAYAFYASEGFESSLSLFAARTYDGRSLHHSAKAISALSLHEMPNSSIGFQLTASLDFEPSVKSEYIVRYIYGFTHGGFAYFVTVQRESLIDEHSFVTRLVRFCQNDSNFYSYTEVTLTCRKKNSVATFLNAAQAALLAPVGKDFSRRFGLPEDEVALYILMARSREKSWQPDAAYGSGLCLYTLTDIRKAFTKAQQDCYRGYGRLLPWITHMEPRCSRNYTIAARMDDDFCGLPLNVGIGSRYPLSADTNFTTDSYLGTSLAVIFHQGKTIAMMGTSDGSLMKVLLDGLNSRVYQVLDLEAGLTKRFPVAAHMVLDSTQEHLYVLTGPRITRVPLRSCIVYSDCSSCVSSGDPLGCGWCEDHCSTGDRCMSSWSKDVCLPVIHSFHPQCGPVSGGTSVTVLGQNFGNGSQSTEGVSASVKVAMVDCTIEHHNDTCIVCLTGQSLRGPTEREVKVTVIDLSRTTVNFDIRGSVSTLQNSFTYKVPMLVSVVPMIGPKAGGTQLTIMGQNLDIGSSRSVTTANHPCSIIRVTSTSLVCKTSAISSHNSTHFLSSWLSSVVDRGPVNVSIDGTVLNVNNSLFVYVDDPVVTNVFPQVSFFSGGIPITVTGSNLHVTQLPTLLVQTTTTTSDAHRFSSRCYSNQNGSVMICQSPNITRSDAVDPLDRSLETRLSFDMDGLKTLLLFGETQPQLSRFQYFVDPVLEHFPGHGHIRQFYDDENYLDLQGRFLDLAAAETDYRVTIGGTDCYVTWLTSTTLLCRPMKPEAMSQVEPYKVVQVHVGNLVFPIGSLQYARRRENLMALITVVPVVSAICLLCLLVFIFWACKVCRERAKVKDAVSFIHVSDTRVSRIPLDMGLEHLEYPGQLDLPIFDAEAWNVLVESNMFIAKNELVVLDIIGQGHFGCVYRGLVCSEADKEEMEVAVKTLKPLIEDSSPSSLEARKFLDEALRMREFDHQHILGLIGISLDQEDMPLVVLPFMKHGDLLSYLRCEDNSPTVKGLMEFCIQIADGMTYLASLKFVHRDLAARNCMLDDSMQVKVADFGLSRDIYERDYYSSDNRKTKLPVKWMALESLEKGIYNTKTDVWSYGVVLWEMMTRGVCPYPEVDNWDVIKFLKSGRRLPQPSYCPDALYQTMLSCWLPVARLRPSFDTLMTVVKDVIGSMESVNDRVSLNVTYVNVSEAVDYLNANADLDLEHGQRMVTLSSQMTAV